MKSIQEVITDPISSPYRGSERTLAMVKEQIEERWGKKCAQMFNPRTDAMPLFSWAKFNYRVKKNERALKSITFIESEDPETGEIRKIKRTVNLFHKKQVEKIIPQHS